MRDVYYIVEGERVGIGKRGERRGFAARWLLRLFDNMYAYTMFSGVCHESYKFTTHCLRELSAPGSCL
jgi:hypothetical protein